MYPRGGGHQVFCPPKRKQPYKVSQLAKNLPGGGKKVKVLAEEMLEAPPAWNEVPDLMMEVEDGMMMSEAAVKQRRDEVTRGRRKRRKEDDIRPEKHEHSPTVFKRTCMT